MQVVCAVEVGWRGMRECSLALARQGASVLVLIKGDVAPDVLAMITRPPSLVLRDVPARRFAWQLARHLLSENGAPTPHLLIVNKTKTHRWAAALGRLRHWRVLRLEETDQGYRLCDASGGDVSLPAAGLNEGEGACSGRP